MSEMTSWFSIIMWNPDGTLSKSRRFARLLSLLLLQVFLCFHGSFVPSVDAMTYAWSSSSTRWLRSVCAPVAYPLSWQGTKEAMTCPKLLSDQSDWLLTCKQGRGFPIGRLLLTFCMSLGSQCSKIRT